MMQAQTAVNGLVLAGGRSRRMQNDKAAIDIGGQTALGSAFELVQRHTTCSFVSIRADQTGDPLRKQLPQIVDSGQGDGPLAGIVSALQHQADVAWLVVACDLPLLDDDTLDRLLNGRNPSALATAFVSAHDGLPEPLCAIYEPASLPVLLSSLAQGMMCPRKILLREQQRVELLPAAGHALDNVNTPEDLVQVRGRLANGTAQ